VTEGDWSAWYRLFSHRRFDEEELGRTLFRETLAHVEEDDFYVVGTDGTQIPRSSYRMPGSSWLRAPRTPVFRVGIHRAQRFMNGCWLTPMVNGFSRAIPLRFLAAFPQKAQASLEPVRKEWEAGLSFVRWVRQQLDAVGRQGQQVLWLADGSYDTVDLWRDLPTEGVVFAVRTASNRALKAFLPPDQRDGRRKYGAKMPSPAEWVKEKLGWTRIKVEVRGHLRNMRYRVEGPFVRQGNPDIPLFLIVVGGETWWSGKRKPRRKERRPAYYLVNAQWRNNAWVLPIAEPLLLAWLWQRWELEVAHREMKSSLGVGEMQCWSLHGAVASVQWSVWVYAILVLAGYRTWGLSSGPAPIASWSPYAKRWSFNTLWRAYRSAFWSTPHFRAIWTRFPANWLDKDTYMAALCNAVGASARA
jgi:hypothetical protein